MSLLHALVGCAGALVTSTCRVCHQQFVRSENHDGACHYHPERWLGAENAKHFGTHTGPGGVPPGLTMFWDCCSKEDVNAPGCCRQRHLTYDDDDNEVLSAALKLRGGARLLPGSGSRLTAVGSLRHAAARLSVPLGPMVVALDFDGVCLDSEPEASRVAWRTACELWPWLTEECTLTERVMDESAYVDRRRLGGQPLCGTAEDAMPLWLRAKMRLLRAVMRDDADALLLVRLCMAEVTGDDPRKRPLTVGEICANWDEALRETLQAYICV